MESYKEVETPSQPGLKCSMDKRRLLRKTTYQELIGTLLQLGNIVRFYISHAVGYLSQFTRIPNETSPGAGKQVLTGVIEAEGLGIVYELGRTEEVSAYSIGDRDQDMTSHKQ